MCSKAMYIYICIAHCIPSLAGSVTRERRQDDADAAALPSSSHERHFLQDKEYSVQDIYSFTAHHIAPKNSVLTLMLVLCCA